MDKNLEEFYEPERIFHNRYAKNYSMKYDIWEIPSLLSINKIINEYCIDSKILDVGCGVGKDTVFFYKNNRKIQKIIGIDVSEESINKAKEWAIENGVSDNVQFQSTIIEKLNYHEEFDIIICKNALHHCADPLYTIQKISEYMRPGGKLIIHEPKSENPLAIIGRKLVIKTTETEKPFKTEEIKKLIMKTKLFKIKSIKYFQILAPSCLFFKYILKNERLMNYNFKIINFFDNIILKVPFMKKVAWIELYICIKK